MRNYNKFVLSVVLLCIGISAAIGCKPKISPPGRERQLGSKPRISISGQEGRLDVFTSLELVDDENYNVTNEFFCPEYYKDTDWGIVVLAVSQLKEQHVSPIRISSNFAEGEYWSRLHVNNEKTVECPFEKDLITLCYNDEAGNVYKMTMPVDDPRTKCLFYDSNSKKRAELIERWLELNKENDTHEMIFDVEKAKAEDEEKAKKEEARRKMNFDLLITRVNDFDLAPSLSKESQTTLLAVGKRCALAKTGRSS